MELTSNLIVAKTGKIRKELTVRNTMGTGIANSTTRASLLKQLQLLTSAAAIAAAALN